MTQRRDAVLTIAAWPLYLSREEAARYVGVSPNLFDAEVKKGRWPQGIERGRRRREKPGRITWYRPDLDAAAARRDRRIGSPHHGKDQEFDEFRREFAARHQDHAKASR